MTKHLFWKLLEITIRNSILVILIPIARCFVVINVLIAGEYESHFCIIFFKPHYPLSTNHKSTWINSTEITVYDGCSSVYILFSRLTVFSFRYVIFSTKRFNKKEIQIKTWKKRNCQKQTFSREKLTFYIIRILLHGKKNEKRTIFVMEL